MNKTFNASSVSSFDATDFRGDQAMKYEYFLSCIAEAIGNLDPQSTAGRVALRLACSCSNGSRFVRRLGGTTYQYARWAVVDPRDGEIMLIETADDRGRWINANCRPWNGGNRL